MLPRLWDPGGVRPTLHVPIDQSRTLAPSRYPYAPYKGHLVNLTSLRTSHAKLDIFIHGNMTGLNTAKMKIPVYINTNIPALMQPTPMHYELCLLCMAHTFPDDRQSSCSSFTVTVTLYIQVTKILKLCVEMTSSYKGHTSHPSFSRFLHLTSRLLHHISGLPKILYWLCLTLLMMLALWGAPYEQPRQGGTPRSTPTYYPGGCVYVRCWFTTPRWGVTHFYQRLRLCSCGTKPQHSRNHWCQQLRDDITMRTPMSS